MEALQKPNETYYLMPLKQLQEYYQPIQMDIYSFFNDMLNINTSNPIQLDENDKVIVLSSELMSNISKVLVNYLLKPDKSHVVIDYVLISLIFTKILHLPQSFDKASAPLRKVLYGVDSSTDRWEYCVKRTDITFGFALSALYLRNTFDEDGRSKANELLENIRLSFEEELDRLQWIDQSTKYAAKNKLKAMSSKVGYPDFIKNQTILDERLDIDLSEDI